MFNIYVSGTSNLGDFLNAMPVLSGLNLSYGKYDIIIHNYMRKFKGIREFLVYQDLFNNVLFYDECGGTISDVILLTSWHSNWDRQTVNTPYRPIETCRYENFLTDHYNLEYDVDDKFEIKFPIQDINIKDKYYVGDRWDRPGMDDRREANILAHLGTDKFEFIDYDNDMLTNCYIIKNSIKPFISNFTGVGMMADLLNKETYVVWKAEDWKPEYRVGDNVSWDGGKDIEQVFKKHFYGDRKAKLIHAKDLGDYVE